jgi:hypothetical protein
LEELGLQQANLTKKHTTNGKFMPKWPLWCFTHFDNWTTWQLMELLGNFHKQLQRHLEQNTQNSGERGLKFSKI